MCIRDRTWTGFWGAQFAAAWNQFPAAMWDEVPKSGQLAGSLNSSREQTVSLSLIHI